MRIGFIGLGAMGAGMAAQLLAAGHEVTVWNRSPEAAKALEAKGARVAATPADAARGEVVHSMLANDAAVREVIENGGVLDAMPRGSVHVNHATISIALAQELIAAHAERGIGYVAAPVFGRPEVAAAGNLNIVVSGDPAAVQRVQPLLDTLGQKVWPLGDDPIRAHILKIAGNFMIATAIESMAEASALTRSYGVSAGDFLEVMTGSLFASPIFKTYGGLIAEERYAPAGFKMSLGFKDVGLARSAAEAKRVPMPFASVVHDNLLEAMAAGDGDLDWSALARVAAGRAHLKDR
ncbi:3-hydroxyisobutyrate dehydrogenase-like beta-hydroxyacid dehydrogenase [Luteibacter rhizovicinus]|uniref:3-hydroxyisobutyrate dehydrogenase-like beta-hydroxyacid dehydrogenase n=2 Tax=Luteibacter rhizovicinus TaxID=242606 RepID=A0A4R3YLT5_9GAMM|nr:3-hydroxyisobutyrate dehydrogenase-like beta-hydroxyacid dehydrogenase [Luteibacter rhizovicinus]